MRKTHFDFSIESPNLGEIDKTREDMPIDPKIDEYLRHTTRFFESVVSDMNYALQAYDHFIGTVTRIYNGHLDNYGLKTTINFQDQVANGLSPGLLKAEAIKMFEALGSFRQDLEQIAADPKAQAVQMQMELRTLQDNARAFVTSMEDFSVEWQRPEFFLRRIKIDSDHRTISLRRDNEPEHTGLMTRITNIMAAATGTSGLLAKRRLAAQVERDDHDKRTLQNRLALQSGAPTVNAANEATRVLPDLQKSLEIGRQFAQHGRNLGEHLRKMMVAVAPEPEIAKEPRRGGDLVAAMAAEIENAQISPEPEPVRDYSWMNLARA